MKIKNLLTYLIIIICISSIAFAGVDDMSSLSVSLVNQDPDPAEAGGIIEIRLAVTNAGGGSANNLFMELVPNYPFEVVSESVVQEVGTINGYQGIYDNDAKIIKYKLKVDNSAPADQYELEVKLYSDDSSYLIKSNVFIDIENKKNAEIVYIDKMVIVPGQQETLSFTVNNVGSSPLNDLTFSWLNEDKYILPVGSDNSKFTKTIGIGESETFEYTVIADTNIDAGLYELKLTLNYYDSLTQSTKTINTIAGIYVGGETDFDIALSETSDSETSFTIANIGSNSASSVSVVIPEQDGWEVSGSRSMIIGNLNTGDYTVASFSLQSVTSTPTIRTTQKTDITNSSGETKQKESSSDLLNIEVVYTDTMGNRKTVEKTVSLNSASSNQNIMSDANSNADFASMRSGRSNSSQSSFSSSIYYILGIVALIAGFFVYRKYKKNNLINTTKNKKGSLNRIFLK